MKFVKRTLKVIFISVLCLLLGFPIRIGDFEFTPGITPAEALSGTIRPDGDSTPLTWTSTGGANHSTEIDEVVTQPTPGTTTDNVSNSTSGDQYTMGTISPVTTVTAITVWVYAMCSKGPSGLSVDLYYSGSTQHTNAVSIGTSYGWLSASFTGLSMTSANLDGLEIYIAGDAGGRTYTVATIYADVTYTYVNIAISITSDKTVPFGTLPANTTQDNSDTGTDDVQTISVDTGPADLDIRSSIFTQGGNTWSYGTSSGDNQVKWEFSKDNSNWTTFEIADNLYVFDTNVPDGNTRSLYLKITTPTLTDSYLEYSTTVTVVGSAP
jgi:hypothetical protein